VSALAWSPDGTALAVATNLGVGLYDPASLGLLRMFDQVDPDASAEVTSLAFSPDGSLLAAGLSNSHIAILNRSDGSLQTTLKGHWAAVNSVAFSSDGDTLASGSDDKTVRLWRLSDDSGLMMLRGHTARVRSVAFAPDGSLLASASEDWHVRIWRVADGTVVHTLGGFTNRVGVVAFSPDGVYLATGTDDGSVKLWNFASQVAVHSLELGNAECVTGLDFSPDSSLLAVGGCDSQTVWQVSDGSQLFSLQGIGMQSLVAFSPDGSRLAVAAPYEGISLWGLP